MEFWTKNMREMNSNLYRYGPVIRFRFLNIASFERQACVGDTTSYGFKIEKASTMFTSRFLEGVGGRQRAVVWKGVNTDPCMRSNESLFVFL